jgi:hypothetical protein
MGTAALWAVACLTGMGLPFFCALGLVKIYIGLSSLNVSKQKNKKN